MNNENLIGQIRAGRIKAVVVTDQYATEICGYTANSYFLMDEESLIPLLPEGYLLILYPSGTKRYKGLLFMKNPYIPYLAPVVYGAIGGYISSLPKKIILAKKRVVMKLSLLLRDTGVDPNARLWEIFNYMAELEVESV